MRIGAPLNHEPNPSLQWMEISSTLQLPGLHLVGLPNAEVNEARERVRAAIGASGLDFPKRRLTLNLSPAYVPKRGTGLDLAIALTIIQSDTAESESPAIDTSVVAWAELGLDGTLKPVGQVLRAVYSCWNAGPTLLLVSEPEARTAREALQLLKDAEGEPKANIEIRGVQTLLDAWNLLACLRLGQSLPQDLTDKSPSLSPSPEDTPPLLPLPPALERVICAAASGGHHILLLGPRGTGKSHAMEWLAALQPKQMPKTQLRQRLIAELRRERDPAAIRPVRRVSAHVKPAALLGSVVSGQIRPGELSLADGGLLIADEFPEWHRDSRECLREPLERGAITLPRSQGIIELPSVFALAANGNLCPCGGWPPEMPLPVYSYGRRPPRCRCGHRERSSYLGRLSGPILERMDFVTLVLSPPREPRTKGKRLALSEPALPRISLLQERVEITRSEMISRWGALATRLPATEIEAISKEHPDWDEHLSSEVLSLRTRHKIIRVALTLSAWDRTPTPGPEHFMEAAMYRPESCGLCA